MSSVTLLPCVDCRFPTLFEASRSAVPLLHLPICLGPRTRTNLRGRRRHYRGHRPLVRGLPRHAQNPLAPSSGQTRVSRSRCTVRTARTRYCLDPSEILLVQR
jgi:hypothetical protein